MLCVKTLAATVVDPELQRDGDIVLHAPDLAAQRLTLFSEHVRSLLELHRVNAQLLFDALAIAHGVFAE